MSACSGLVARLGGTARASRRVHHYGPAVWLPGIGGLIAYNWWVLALLKPGLLRSPDELFSNLEAIGQPYAAQMRAADILAALLLLGAFAAAGARSVPAGRGEWLGLVTFALAGLAGGLFPQVCADGLSRSCMSAELSLRLPASQYLHDGAGVVEFTAITLTMLFAFRRTRAARTPAARTYRLVLSGVSAGYPILGLAYLLNEFGGVVEALFLTGFTAVIAAQLTERAAADEIQEHKGENGRSPLTAARR